MKQVDCQIGTLVKDSEVSLVEYENVSSYNKVT